MHLLYSHLPNDDDGYVLYQDLKARQFVCTLYHSVRNCKYWKCTNSAYFFHPFQIQICMCVFGSGLIGMAIWSSTWRGCTRRTPRLANPDPAAPNRPLLWTVMRRPWLHCRVSRPNTYEESDFHYFCLSILFKPACPLILCFCVWQHCRQVRLWSVQSNCSRL